MPCVVCDGSGFLLSDPCPLCDDMSVSDDEGELGEQEQGDNEEEEEAEADEEEPVVWAKLGDASLSKIPLTRLLRADSAPMVFDISSPRFEECEGYESTDQEASGYGYVDQEIESAWETTPTPHMASIASIATPTATPRIASIATPRLQAAPPAGPSALAEEADEQEHVLEPSGGLSFEGEAQDASDSLQEAFLAEEQAQRELEELRQAVAAEADASSEGVAFAADEVEVSLLPASKEDAAKLQVWSEGQTQWLDCAVAVAASQQWRKLGAYDVPPGWLQVSWSSAGDPEKMHTKWIAHVNSKLRLRLQPGAGEDGPDVESPRALER